MSWTVFIFQSNTAQALTPIARVDAVPYQRIEYGTTFNFGVVAFSKEGIDRVEFNISGQGYTGGVKTATEMTKNTQVASIETTGHDGVWEYWVPISSNEFTSNGAITITPTVYGKDNDTRILDPITLIVEATEIGTHTTAWVDSVSGNNATGQVDDINHPYLTIAAAVSAAQTAHSGNSNGNIIYLKEGTYTFGDISANTTNEWLTITRASGATKENVIIQTGGYITTNLLRVKEITIQSSGSYGYVFVTDNPGILWFDRSRAMGSGRYLVHSNPVYVSHQEQYSTGSYYYNMDSALSGTPLVRGALVEYLGNDALQNVPFAVNVKVHNINPGLTGWHADAYQAHTAGVPPASNRILYNFHATDLHIEGIFMRTDGGTATNNAFVNVLIEMRDPSVPNESDQHSFETFGLNGDWDHIIVWNCSFFWGHSGIWPDSISNASFVGNYFRQLLNASSAVGTTNIPIAFPENIYNNEFLFNHLEAVRGIEISCTQNSADIAKDTPCPQWYAKMPDSSATTSASHGPDVIDISNPSAVNFGSPIAESVLINRIPFATVPTDIYGNPRIGNPDIGAVEYNSGDMISPSSPTGLSVL